MCIRDRCLGLGGQSGKSRLIENGQIGQDLAVNFDIGLLQTCLLYTSDAADERSSVDLGGRRIIKKKNKTDVICRCTSSQATVDTGR